MVKACQIVVRSMFLNKFYSEFARVTRIKFPFFPRPNLIFYKPYVTSRNGPLIHNTAAYTSHFQNKNTSVIVEYHNKLWGNSKSNYTFVCAPEKTVQELLSKSVQFYKHPSSVNSPRPSDAFMCQLRRPSLVQIMVCRLFGDNPLSDPLITSCQSDHWE